jgi:hypothetical protein
VILPWTAPRALAEIDRHLTARKPSALPDPQLIKQIGRGASVSHLKPVNIVGKTSAAATQKRAFIPAESGESCQQRTTSTM